MLATEVLTAHHNELRALFDRLAASPPSRHGERRRLLDTLAIELELHEQIEDELFYPVVEDISTMVPLGHAERRQLGDQLAVRLRTDPASEAFLSELAHLRALLEHHGGLEEEDRMFPEVVARRRGATRASASIPAGRDPADGQAWCASPPRYPGSRLRPRRRHASQDLKAARTCCAVRP